MSNLHVTLNAIFALLLQFTNFAADYGGLANASLVHFLVRQIVKWDFILQFGVVQEK